MTWARYTAAIIVACTLSSAGTDFAQAGGSRGGHYEGGVGSSHKGGRYMNPATGDHYQQRNGVLPAASGSSVRTRSIDTPADFIVPGKNIGTGSSIYVRAPETAAPLPETLPPGGTLRHQTKPPETKKCFPRRATLRHHSHLYRVYVATHNEMNSSCSRSMALADGLRLHDQEI
jgi:hypothetical protein